VSPRAPNPPITNDTITTNVTTTVTNNTPDVPLTPPTDIIKPITQDKVREPEKQESRTESKSQRSAPSVSRDEPVHVNIREDTLINRILTWLGIA